VQWHIYCLLQQNVLVILKHLRYKQTHEIESANTALIDVFEGIMTEVYTILTDRYCKNVQLQLELHQDMLQVLQSEAG